ncbi:EboA domain-containing protein [Streptomyces sp. NPDC007863]|uniref:EboA domain-containing protein n=1 Tax=Streptomyces sp. NPDC007863 TaxID=3154894 RepID=UPI0033E96317
MLTPPPSWTRAGIAARLPDDHARAWFAEALADAGRAAAAPRAPSPRDPAARAATAPRTPPAPPPAHSADPAWQLRFVTAGRHCGQDAADAVRALLLIEARAATETLTRLYRQGSAAERRAVLLALPFLVDGPQAAPLVDDALRTHDTRLIAAAVGPYAAAHLAPHAWRHAVLKCLFTGVPLTAVADLARRAADDAELARMLAAHAAERTAAGREIPRDLRHALTLTGVPTQEP